MKLENQVCSLESAKKLKELGFVQESLFYWSWCITEDSNGHAEIVDEDQNYAEQHREEIEYECASAYTVAELGELLPCHISQQEKGHAELNWHMKTGKTHFAGECDRWGIEYTCNQICPGPTSMHRLTAFADTEAEARAKMLIYLKENKLI